MSMEQLEKELEKKIKEINPEWELKVKALQFALQTNNVSDGMNFQLNGPDEVIAAAKKYYEFINEKE